MDKKIEFVKGKIFQLESGKKYLLVFDRGSMSQDDAEYLGEMIKKEYGAECPVTVFLKGGVESMKLVEVPEK